MPLYLVESTLPGITADGLAHVRRLMAEASEQLTDDGNVELTGRDLREREPRPGLNNLSFPVTV